MEHLVTFALAIIGTVLGCINTFDLLNKRRVRLRIVPRSAFRAGDGIWNTTTEHLPGSAVSIEVINLSAFPVTIEGVGYTLPGHNARFAVVRPMLFDSKPWPRRLDPRDSVAVYAEIAGIAPTIGKAFAKTACGVTRFGNSPALKDLKRKLRKS